MAAIKSLQYRPESFGEVYRMNHGKDWPIVYVLKNETEMYVGQTSNAVARFRQHYKNPERRVLKTAYLVDDDEFNVSATLDIESWLIQYFAADSVYKLQNGNKGLANHNYYDREKYEAKFELIWSEFQSKGIAKEDLLQLKNTDLFKFSPYKALTTEQQEIVKSIYNGLTRGTHTTNIINGVPGTGKSVLAVYLAKYLVGSDSTKQLKFALVIPMVSLRKTLKKVFRSVKGLSPSMVIGPNEVTGNHYDLLIVDEAHRLKRRVNLAAFGPFDKANQYFGLGKGGNQLDWVMLSSDTQVLFYDKNQSVIPGDIRPEDIGSLDAKQYHLTSQLRVMAGGDYVGFIENLLVAKPTARPNFPNYDLRYFDDIEQMVREVKDKNREHGLARLVAGYAWTWQTNKQTSQNYDIDIDGLKLKWNTTNIDWVNSKNAIDEVGCIHTIQGYDLNYVGVIIGPELKYNTSDRRLEVDKDKYMDFNGKRSVESLEELTMYIINIYKTLLTRGIKGSYIHAVDTSLANYLKSRLQTRLPH